MIKVSILKSTIPIISVATKYTYRIESYNLNVVVWFQFLSSWISGLLDSPKLISRYLLVDLSCHNRNHKPTTTLYSRLDTFLCHFKAIHGSLRLDTMDNLIPKFAQSSTSNFLVDRCHPG